MSENLVLCSVAPPISRQGRVFGLLVPATTTTSWPNFSSLALTVWAARSVLRRNNNNNNNNNKKNPYNYNRDSALRARTPKNPNNYNRDSALRARTPNASSIKRGSCFEGIRVCFYGIGQPWFIADSETHRKWTTGSQKHTHTHVQLFIDNYWSRESRE